MRASILVFAYMLPGVVDAAPIGFAHQLTHSINDSPFPTPDGRRMVYIVGIAGREQLFGVDCQIYTAPSHASRP